MKKVTSKLILVLVLLAFSCNTDENGESIQTDAVQYDSLISGLQEINSVQQMIDLDPVSFEQTISSIESRIAAKTNENIVPDVYLSEEVVFSKDEFSDIYSDSQKEFLVEFFEGISNSEDGFISDVVESYKSKLSNNNFNEDEKNQLLTLLIASEQSIKNFEEAILDNETSKSSFFSKSSAARGGFGDCFRQNAGRAIGRGIATGAIAGGIRGAIVGGVGGTVALPGVGTATGAVGGAVFGAAYGAVQGAVTGALWTAADCGAGRSLSNWIRDL